VSLVLISETPATARQLRREIRLGRLLRLLDAPGSRRSGPIRRCGKSLTHNAGVAQMSSNTSSIRPKWPHGCVGEAASVFAICVSWSGHKPVSTRADATARLGARKAVGAISLCWFSCSTVHYGSAPTFHRLSRFSSKAPEATDGKLFIARYYAENSIFTCEEL